MLDYIMLSRTSKMSDVNLIHDKHITHSSQRKHSHFCQTVCCLACCQQSSGYAVPLPILHMEKKQNMVIDISLIPFIYFCLWTIQFKVGQDATIAKCVSNKLYPSQDGSSLEALLAIGSKSRACANIPAATTQEHTAGAPTASADLAAQRASDREPAGTSGNQQHLLDR